MHRLEPRRTLPRRLRAFIYDFDNTIVGTERMNEGLFADLIRGEFGAPLSAREQELLHGLAWDGVFEWLSEHRGLGGRREEIWQRFLAVKREAVRRRAPPLATGLDRMLALPAAHAIVTGSYREELEMVMAAAGLSDRHFGAIVCGEDCTRGKPHPDGYLRALEVLAVPREEALVFEDSRPGIASARMAGITVAFVSELAAHDRAGEADLSFPTLAGAWEAVRGLAANPPTAAPNPPPAAPNPPPALL
jgi:HAD superfamily hydrolase (TIGR01509 family)